jgi:hypothetical protein
MMAELSQNLIADLKMYFLDRLQYLRSLPPLNISQFRDLYSSLTDSTTIVNMLAEEFFLKNESLFYKAPLPIEATLNILQTALKLAKISKNSTSNEILKVIMTNPERIEHGKIADESQADICQEIIEYAEGLDQEELFEEVVNYLEKLRTIDFHHLIKDKIHRILSRANNDHIKNFAKDFPLNF